MQQENTLKKVVIVTGGSRGIGAATSIQLANNGYSVCVNYKQQSSRAEKVVSNIVANGGEAFSFQADVSNETDVIRMFEAVRTRYGHITHLVNNAGVLNQQSSLVDIEVDRFKNVLQSNVISCFLCCKEYLKQKPSVGAIVNVSSAAARTGAPFEYIDYAASKGAIDTLTKGLSIELAATNIRVNAVRPGFIHTEMHADGGEPDRVNRLSTSIPMLRGGTTEEVANAITWLLSDHASYITGSFIDIAGGK